MTLKLLNILKLFNKFLFSKNQYQNFMLKKIYLILLYKF